jgi:transglycosylase-like protein with SLT domain
MRRNGVILPAAVVAAIAVGGVSTAAWLMGPSASGASGAAAGLEDITNTKAVALLQQEHQQMIVMSNASRTLTVVAKAKVATPSSAVSQAQQSSGGSGGSSSSSTGTAAEPTAAAPDPGTAQSTAYNMLASFGFSTSQFGCLQDLWQRESGWSYDAENPSGAYGIPQSLPASKMASAGSDYLTNPATQIKWGLGYIKAVYGTPCAAWNFELANNYY